MSSGHTYLEGGAIRVQATFAVGGVNTDPTTVTLKVKSPDGSVSTYTYELGEVTKSAEGIYNKEITPNAVGKWWYRWIGTGTAAGVAETSITILASQID